VEVAERLRKMRHPIVFTHGDLKHHNIMVLDGHISGFLDWESVG
jgi:aminoglycoside phosphotransferase (APT) family kinase protein